jgi:hypothetical protein
VHKNTPITLSLIGATGWQRINMVYLNPGKNVIDEEQSSELKKRINLIVQGVNQFDNHRN